MTVVEQVFYLIRNEIEGTPLPDNVEYDIKRIYALLSRHDLAHLAGDALFRNNLLPKSRIADAFKRRMISAVYRFERQKVEFEKVKKAFEIAKIPYIPLKGAVIRKFYPKPWMRTSCDIDILVKKEDFFRAAEYLTETLGYKREKYFPQDVSFYSESKVHIELHHSLINENNLEGVDKILSSVWEYAEPCDNGFEYRLTDEMFYFYHIAHMAKHFKNGGCGIRPFIDLWILNNNSEFNKNTLNKENLLGKSCLVKFADACESLSEVWLKDKENNEITLLLQRYIMCGGVYGNLHNRASVSEGTRKKRTLVSYLWKPYRELKFWYPGLSKHKWLLPFYEAKRWFTIIFGGALAHKIREKRILNSMEKEKLDIADRLILELGLKQN